MPTYRIAGVIGCFVAIVLIGAMAFAYARSSVPVSSRTELPVELLRTPMSSPVELLRTPMSSPDLYRTRLPDGWLVWAQNGGMVVVNDPEHKWSLK